MYLFKINSKNSFLLILKKKVKLVVVLILIEKWL
jgi:hypothetical protein